MEEVSIKYWFSDKLASELNLPRLYYLSIFCGLKETEKAVYALFFTGYDATGRFAKHRCHWIPKSAIENFEQLEMISEYDEAVVALKNKYEMYS